MAIHTHTRFPLHALALAALQAACVAHAAEQVTVTGRLESAPASVAGFGDVPLAKSPFQAVTLGSAALADAGVDSLADITRLDASLADAYNAPGYWSALTVRGFTLDNRYNYQRDGLPINAETAIALENKERIELLKGTSGAQAGTSSPGGLANLVVKRPRGIDQSTLLLGWSERGNWKAAADIERRLGDGEALGWRINAAVESLEPQIRDSQGERQMAAAAGRARFGNHSVFDVEIEWSHQSQPSVPGFSMLGDRVPSAREIDPRINLNNQAWSLPVVFDGTTASLRWTETLAADWHLVAHVMSQQLRTDDRIAFPYGCSVEEAWDRYCSDGSFDLYDYRSEGEHRDTLAGALTLAGRLNLAGMAHDLSTGLTLGRYRARLGGQAFNWAGIGQIDGSAATEPAPELAYPNTNRDERSSEWHLRDRVALTDASALWAGLRVTRLHREARLTDGSASTRPYTQSFTTPWVAFSHQLTEHTLAYLSWGEGVESEAVPDLPEYALQTAPARKSRQTELGLKYDGRELGATLAWFDIRQPRSVDVCADDGSRCTRELDGHAHHSGIEASGSAHFGPLALRASAMWLRARREGARDAAENGLVPTNVAERSARLLASWQVAGVPGLVAQASLDHEGPRYVLPDNSARIPGWTTAGLAARYGTRALGHDWLLRLGVDNLFDRRAWRESPYQFGHAYLYPLEPRSFRASLQATL